MKQVTIDYIFSTSASILFKRLSTPSGLSEWFADDVNVKNDIYNFRWNKTEQPAKLKIDRKDLCVKINWLEDDKDFLKFNIEKSSMSKDITLYITDFVEDNEDLAEAFELWDSTITRLKRKLGVN